MSIAALIQQHAMTNKLAVVQGRVKVTYQELLSEASLLAEALRQRRNLGPGDRVALVLPNSPRFLAIVLASSLGGWLLAPVDPKYTSTEIRSIFNWLQPELIMGQGPAPEGLEDNWLDLESSTLNDFRGDSNVELPLIGGESDFFLGLTSGSCGQPKAIIRSQDSWTSSFSQVIQRFGLGDSSVMLIPGPLSYSASLVAALLTLYAGGTVELQDTFETAAVFQALERVSAVFMVPSMYRTLLARGFRQKLHHRKKPLTMISAGEKMTAESIAELCGLPEWICLYEYYGAAELSFVSCLDAFRETDKAASVGRPFPEVNIFIGDPLGNEPFQPGQAGTIWAKSPWLAKGYYGTQTGSKKHFHGGWATAGDMGYLDKDGYLHVLGRGNSYISSGGVKVCCAEVEAVLEKHPLVSQAVAFGVPDRLRGQAVAVAIESSAGRSGLKAELHQFCLQYLATPKRPKHYLILAEFPRNTAGKVDRPLIMSLLHSG